jgi:ABC-type cobalamin transport system ATPase subunit
MTRQFGSSQLRLFNEDEPRVELELAQKVALTTLMQVLLREVATALANGEIGDDQDHV